MEPVFRGSDIAAICFSVSIMVVQGAVKEGLVAPQNPDVDVGFPVLLADQRGCGRCLPH
jgi:hypothetical protein